MSAVETPLPASPLDPLPTPPGLDVVALLASLVESSDDAIVTKSLDGTVLSWNRGAERIFGYSAEEIVGRPIAILAPPERTDEMPGILAALRRGERIDHFETERVRKDGQRIYVSLSISPLWDAAGVVVGAAKIARDITERRLLQAALEEGEERFRQLAENIDSALFLSEAPGGGSEADAPVRIAYASSGYERLWGRSREELFAKASSWIEAVHPEDRPRVKAAVAAQPDGGLDQEFRITRPDGEVRWVHYRAFPVRNASGESYRTAGIVEDITLRKLAEVELARAHAELLARNDELVRTRLAVEIERRRYQELFELAPDGYLVTDLVGNILEANRAAAGLLGMPREKIEGRPLARYVSAPRRRAFRARLRKLAARGGTESWELPLSPAGRPHIEAALTVTAVHDSGGKATGLRWLIRDVTDHYNAEHERARLLASEQAERARAEAAEQRAAFLAEASGLLAASLDLEATLENLARLTVPRLADSCQIYEKDLESGAVKQIVAAHRDPEKEVALRRFGELYRIDPADPRSMIGTVLRTGRSDLRPALSDADAIASLPAGEMRDLALTLAVRSAVMVPLSSRGRTLGTLVLAMSDSGRRYGEADLALAEELAWRAGAALDNARLYGEARQASAAKDQFLATLSHELRTPLTPVLALVSSLEGDTALPEEGRRAIVRIRRNVELEARLIDDLLDLTRVARGKLELKREVADLAQIVTHAVETCCPGDADPSQPKVEQDLAAADHRLWGDASRLIQVFWNLLHNACKFTPPEGEVRVSTRREEGTAGPVLVVEVADTGIGIEPELLPTIFDAFEQGRRGTVRRYGGLGLGLAITKAIVEMHGGRIAAHSEGYGRGATFVVRLPVGQLPATQDRPAPAETHAAEGGERPLHILLVEDHADTAEVMAELLRAVGHRVTPARGVREALAAAEAAFAGEGEEGGIDLVLSDLGLPDGSGLDLMRELTGRWALRGIALSGYGMDEDVERSREAGFCRHITKPVDLTVLVAAIRESAG